MYFHDFISFLNFGIEGNPGKESQDSEKLDIPINCLTRFQRSRSLIGKKEKT